MVRHSKIEGFFGNPRSETIILAVALTIAFVVLSAPFAMRAAAGNPPMFGNPSVGTLAMLRSSDFSSMFMEDTIHGVNSGFGIFYRLLITSSLPDSLLVFLPILGGLISVWLFWVLLKKFLSPFAYVPVLLVYALNPLFIAIFTELSRYFFLAILFMAAAISLSDGKKGWLWLSLSAILLEDPVVGFFSGAFLVLFQRFLLERGLRKKPAIIPMTAVPLAAAIGIVSIFTHGPSVLVGFSASGVLSDLGGKYGLPAAFILLCLLGAAQLWKFQKSSTVVWLAYLLCFFGFFWMPARVISLFFLSVFAGAGIIAIAGRKWSFDFMRQFTVLLIACAIFLSVTTAISVMVNENPSNELEEGLKSMSNYLPVGEKVLANPDLGEFIEYYSGRVPVDDAYMEQRGIGSWEVNKQTFLSRNLAAAESGFEAAGTRILILDPVLESYLHENREGMLFLINATDGFRKIHDAGIVQAYEFIPSVNVQETSKKPDDGR